MGPPNSVYKVMYAWRSGEIGFDHVRTCVPAFEIYPDIQSHIFIWSVNLNTHSF